MISLINHESRDRENSEVVIIYPHVFLRSSSSQSALEDRPGRQRCSPAEYPPISQGPATMGQLGEVDYNGIEFIYPLVS